MRDGKGYLLPENPQPDGYQCLLLYIPDDPTGYYLAAMAGAFVDMGAWLNWEKDGTNRASLAASTWKQAIDFTFDNGWLQCEDMNDKLDDILDQLRILNNMNINVNCGGCGCGCHGGTNGNNSDLLNPDGTPINAPPAPPPSNLPPESFVGQWTCDAANEFVDQWLDFYNNIFNAQTFGYATVAAILAIAGATAIMTAGISVIIAVVAALALGPAITFSGWVATWLAENRNGLICAMVNSTTPAAAYQNVSSYLQTHKADQSGTFAGEWIENIFSLVLSDTIWDNLFTPDSFEIRLANIGSTCNCQSAIPIPDFDGWFLLPALEGEEFVGTNAQYTTSNYVWTFTGEGAGQEAQSYPSFEEFLAIGRAWLGTGQVATTNEHAGYVIQRIGGDTNIQTFNISGTAIIGLDAAGWSSSDVWSEWNTNSDLPKLDFQAAIEAAFDGLVISHEPDQTFSNLDQHRMTMLGLSDDARSVQFRLWAIVAGSALNIA